MADGVMMIGWNYPKPGREQQAMALFERSLAYYGRLQQDGQIESFEPIFLAHHGGDLNGFILLKGEPDKLHEVRRSDEFLQIMVEAGYCIDGVGAVDGYMAGGIQSFLVHFNKLIGS